MTLIIAGFEKQKDPWETAWKATKNGLWNMPDAVAKAEHGKLPIKLVTNGLFAVADSLISTPGTHASRPILSGLRKIHPIAVQLWKPYIVNREFRNYSEIHLSTQCFVAFAGSTLTATHVLNTISEHLGMLRITFESDDIATHKPRYVVKRDCEYVHIRDTKKHIEWSDDMYSSSDFENILTAEHIAEVIEHSINVAFNSAKRYRLDENAFKQMQTEFVAGIQCPATRQYRLFSFRFMTRLSGEGLMEAYTVRQETYDDQVVVLGMRDEFEVRAQVAYQMALKAGTPTGRALFDFLNLAIDEVVETDNVLIDRPSSHKHLENGTLKKIGFKKSRL